MASREPVPSTYSPAARVIRAAGFRGTPVPGLPLFGVILVSQNLNGILLPIVLIFMLRLVNKPRLMGNHTNPTWLNVVAWSLTGLIILLTGILFGSSIAGWL